MSTFDDYKNRFKHVRMERRNGVLQAAIHTDGGPFVMSFEAHAELGYAFAEIARDEDNKVVILTGTGDNFCAKVDRDSLNNGMGFEKWDAIYKDGKHLLMNLLDIEVPVVGAINGPAPVMAQLALLSDVVLAADTASFSDGHYPNGNVAGDGVHVVWPLLLGLNRARYFLITGQVISAREAQALGVVNEVLAPDKLMTRAWELAEQMASKPRLANRYTRVALTQPIKQAMLSNLGYGLAMEGMCWLSNMRR